MVSLYRIGTAEVPDTVDPANHLEVWLVWR